MRLSTYNMAASGRLRSKRAGTRTEARFRLSSKRTSPFKSAGASVQSTTGSRDVRISGSNAVNPVSRFLFYLFIYHSPASSFTYWTLWSVL